VVPAAADQVSASVAQLFSRYAEDFHGLAGRAVVFHEQFVQHLTARQAALF
jgi:PE family